ncbi:PREDICTED: uncharacterized protein LOC106750299 isoform X5 [Dinoponera quadriceps]|uniref:Uncharacterized protein LOC106750299 isoform X5 n=1 Tax=Dinoponera quadriceps TaxID=609295 RepID=A0A6P3Y6T5_DINQU|nr:PREDICTED: uncharacterized protein LOC106750299 isoform X5 [Dinoponera quadriceps]
MSFVYVSRIKSQVRGLEIRLSRAGNPYDDICTVNGRGGEGNQRYVSAPMYPGKDLRRMLRSFLYKLSRNFPHKQLFLRIVGDNALHMFCH